MFLVFKNGVKSIQTVGYNGSSMVDGLSLRSIQSVLNQQEDIFEKSWQSVNVVNILDVIGKKLF